MRVFFATDIHGSEVCWRKFLNAGPFYGADVVIVGGDITGKAMVPIVERHGRWETTLQDHLEVLESEEAVRDIETKILNRGYYPIRVSEEEYRHMQEDEDAVDKRFKEVMLEGTERWIAMADEKLKGKVHRVVVCPANDDMFEIDPVLKSGHVVEMGTDEPLELDGFSMVSYGWTNPTPWDTFRELPEEELGRRIDKIVEKVAEPDRTIFNFHAPPHATGTAPGGFDLRSGRHRTGPAAARAARPHPREQGRGPHRQDAGPEPRQLLRGGRPPGRHRHAGREEAEGEELSAGDRVRRPSGRRDRR